MPPNDIRGSEKQSHYDLTTYLRDRKKLINSELEKIFKDLGSSSHIVKAMKYSLMAGGKRVRPILCLAASEAAGGELSSALPAAF